MSDPFYQFLLFATTAGFVLTMWCLFQLWRADPYRNTATSLIVASVIIGLYALLARCIMLTPPV